MREISISIDGQREIVLGRKEINGLMPIAFEAALTKAGGVRIVETLIPVEDLPRDQPSDPS